MERSSKIRTSDGAKHPGCALSETDAGKTGGAKISQKGRYSLQRDEDLVRPKKPHESTTTQRATGLGTSAKKNAKKAIGTNWSYFTKTDAEILDELLEKASNPAEITLLRNKRMTAMDWERLQELYGWADLLLELGDYEASDVVKMYDPLDLANVEYLFGKGMIKLEWDPGWWNSVTYGNNNNVEVQIWSNTRAAPVRLFGTAVLHCHYQYGGHSDAAHRDPVRLKDAPLGGQLGEVSAALSNEVQRLADLNQPAPVVPAAVV